jgi:hypothetical protein
MDMECGVRAACEQNICRMASPGLPLTPRYRLITCAKRLIWNARANEQRVARVVRTNGRRSVSRAGVLGPGALSLGAD